MGEWELWRSWVAWWEDDGDVVAVVRGRGDDNNDHDADGMMGDNVLDCKGRDTVLAIKEVHALRPPERDMLVDRKADHVRPYECIYLSQPN